METQLQPSQLAKALQSPQRLRYNRFKDHRGLFMPINWPDYEWFQVQQTNISESEENVIRGLHSQAHPYEQNKLLFVLEGTIKDICVNKYSGVNFEFILEEGDGLYIPNTYFHGFSVLRGTSRVLYQIDKPYMPSQEITINPLDPDLKLDWGLGDLKPKLSDKDENGIGWTTWKATQPH